MCTEIGTEAATEDQLLDAFHSVQSSVTSDTWEGPDEVGLGVPPAPRDAFQQILFCWLRL